MNLKTYNAQNAPHVVPRKESKRLAFSFNDKGRFIIGRTLFEKMGKPGAVVVLQDNQYPSDFYLRASKDPMAFPMKAGSRNQFIFKSNTLAGIIAEAIHLTPPYALKFKVLEKEDGLFCIGTRKPIVKKPSETGKGLLQSWPGPSPRKGCGQRRYGRTPAAERSCLRASGKG